MKDWNREQVARHFFNLMNAGRFDNPRYGKTTDAYWKMYIGHGWADGYYRLADEVIAKGYKP